MLIGEVELKIETIAVLQSLKWIDALAIRKAVDELGINFNVEEHNPGKINTSNELWKLYQQAVDNKVNKIVSEMNLVFNNLPETSIVDYTQHFPIAFIPSKRQWKLQMAEFNEQVELIRHNVKIAPVITN